VANSDSGERRIQTTRFHEAVFISAATRLHPRYSFDPTGLLVWSFLETPEVAEAQAEINARGEDTAFLIHLINVASGEGAKMRRRMHDRRRAMGVR
jgi:hypothetical protein